MIILIFYYFFRFYSQYHGSYFSSIKEKIKNAYMLIYDRIVPFQEKSDKKEEKNGENQETEEAKKEDSKENNDDSKEKKDSKKTDLKSHTDSFLDELLQENIKLHLHRNIFSGEYFSFVCEFVMEKEYTENFEYIDYPFEYKDDKSKNDELQLLKMGIIFFLTAMIREKDRQMIVKFLPFLKIRLSKNLPLCQWLLYSISSKDILIEFFLDCPISVLLIFFF